MAANGLPVWADTKASLIDLLTRTHTKSKLMGLHRQLVWHLATHAEKGMFYTMQRGKLHPRGLYCTMDNIMDNLFHPKKLDFQILCHVIVAKEVLADELHLCWANDKYSTGGMHILNIVFSTMGNVGVIGVPQVPP